ncbi:hypothetical protein C1645_839633 [Glomus cerebriforme]|uniref:Uncharacterized protein n=1 Tax=Glomus cerebriforme TaxID=658196 RepID=A0A397SB11_9GLOM|nr:hypothetical protein C1645_839633 [Glomus cerebriforme]
MELYHILKYQRDFSNNLRRLKERPPENACFKVNRFWCSIAVPILWTTLLDNNIELPLSTFSNKLLFNYLSFLSQISLYDIGYMIKINEKDLLVQEIYKLFIKNCNNIKEFSWIKEKPLFQYPGTSSLFSQPCSLEIHLHFVNSSSLFGMAQI